MRGGSRFNLRWSGSIPADQLTPEAVMKLLADYIDFTGQQAAGAALSAQTVAAAPSQSLGSNSPTGSPTAQLKRGMKMDEVTQLFGQGKQVSQSVSGDGLKTQVVEYVSGDRRVDVTYVEGLVVRYSISSN